jgi:Holliday junction resolvase/AAA+ ATPase superfamily predicted ATPase
MGTETSTPVTGAQFFNRQVEFEKLDALVRDARAGVRRWLAVLGHRKIGKTSLLAEFLRRHPDELLCYVDAWECRASPVQFFVQFLRSLIATVIRHRKAEAEVGPMPALGGAFPASFVQAVARLGLRSLDDAVQLHEELSSGEVSVGGIRAVLGVPAALAAEIGEPLIVLCDEFQELEKFAYLKRFKGEFQDVFGLVRTVWQAQQGVSYVVAGSRLQVMRQILLDETSPFFLHFEILNLGAFERKDTLKMLQELVGLEQQAAMSGTVERILDLLGDHPFYVRAVVQDVYAAMGRASGKATSLDEAFKEAFEAALFSPNGRLGLFMEQRYRVVTGESSMLESVLRGFASPARITDVAERLHVRTGAVSTAVSALLTEDILEKRPDGLYQFTDPTFALWLQGQTDFQKATPPLLVGTDAEQAVARRLAADGFRSVYQSRASRVSFDLLAIHDTRVLGFQVKKTGLPFSLSEQERTRLIEDARRLGFRAVLALVLEGEIRFYDLGRVAAETGSFSVREETEFTESALALLVS